MEGDHHSVGRSSFNGPFALGNLLAKYGMAHSDRLSRGTTLLAGRHDADRSQSGQAFDQGTQTSGVNSVVVGYQNIGHGFSRKKARSVAMEI